MADRSFFFKATNAKLPRKYPEGGYIRSDKVKANVKENLAPFPP